MNLIAKKFRATFNEELVIDPTDNEGPGSEWRPNIHSFADHPTTEGVQNIRILAGCTLSSDNPNATIIAWGDEDAYSSTYPAGSLPPVSMAVTEGQGRAYFHCDSSLGLNADYFRNVMTWLSTSEILYVD